jgi:hypothetical protein
MYLRGEKRYSQSHSTPFLNTPLLEDFGFLSNQDNVNAILAGTYECPQEVDAFTKTIIQELQRPPELTTPDNITGITSTEEHI